MHLTEIHKIEKNAKNAFIEHEIPFYHTKMKKPVLHVDTT